MREQRLSIGMLCGWQVYGNSIPNNFINTVMHGVRTAAHDHGCNLLLSCGISPMGPTITRPGWPASTPDTDFVPVGPWNTDGLLMVGPPHYESQAQYIQNLRATGFPVVCVGGTEGGPAVVLDNEGGIRQAVRHLVAHGHRRIAYIAGPEADINGDGGERLRAFQACAQEYSLTVDSRLIAYGDHILEGGQHAMQQILDTGVPFTAVLASNDESVIGAMQTLQKAEVRIPQDVALVGFDDSPELIFQTPPITSVHHPTFERGYQALELLLDYLEGRKTEVEIITSPTQLVVRQSCGCQLDNVLIVSGETTLSAQLGKRIGLESQLVQAMARVVLAETQCLNSDHIHYLCERLVRAFTASLQKNNPAEFHLTLEETLQSVEREKGDVHVWQAAVSALRDELPALIETYHPLMPHQQAEDMLHQGRTIISESLQRRYWRNVVTQVWKAENVGALTARLFTVLDEEDVFQVFAEYLPNVGVQRAMVAFFEPEGDDPTAWSTLCVAPGMDGAKEGLRFPSRQFPPAGLLPEDDPFTLALLPLKIQEKLAGYVTFDTSNLDLYATIVQQLASALMVARLYKEVTEGRRLAEEGRRLAEEADRMKSRFLSTVSHELHTPLSLIVGLSEMLLREKDKGGSSMPEPCYRDIDRIYASAQHLDGLIRDVLDLAQSDVGQLRLVFEPLDLAEVLHVVAAVGEQMAHDKGLDWQAEIPGDLPMVWGDRTRLRQVTLNLISNAVKFTAQGSVTLLASADGTTVTVAIRDTGLGIPLEEQEIIFDEFRQSERTAERGYGGLGLGLAICKRLVEMHGGEIGARSSGEEGAGSTFSFTLPTIQEPPQRETTVALSPPREQTVLLLTENPVGEGRLRKHLVGQGFEVQTLRIGEGRDWFSQIKMSPPGVVVLDTGMASERGWEILRVLKGNPITKDITLMFYSLTEERDSGSVLELDYLSKPVGTTELVQALERQGMLDGTDGRENTILIADDEPGVLEVHVRIVQSQSENYRVLKAHNGKEALEVIRREHPDLVLLDLMMPELDGFGVLGEMQAEATTCNIPVIVLTGQTLTEEDIARLNRGVTAVLGKGLFSVEETLAHVEKALVRKQKPRGETRRLIRKAMAYIHEHYAEPVSRQAVADHVGMSSSHFARCFRQEVGVTPIAYLNRYRVNQAKELLSAGDMTVTEIAMAVGFSDSSYFSKVFRREVGVSPSDYRRA
jgi:signal transduction histidine kinase/DNA-binding LacI/PurR family transcriptional regulator/AraC-like DNA-binding protein/response regulator of citrate/malate metabolism